MVKMYIEEVEMSEDLYNYDAYYGQLVVLSERLKSTKLKTLVVNFQGLLLNVVLFGPLFISNDFLVFMQQMLLWLIVITMIAIAFVLKDDVVKTQSINALKEKDYETILKNIYALTTVKEGGVNRYIIDLFSVIWIAGVSYLIYKMNLFYVNYPLSFIFFLCMFSIKHNLLTKGLYKYKTILKDSLRELEMDIKDIVPEAEDWVINRKVNA